ncbi:MAG: hypothetical protein DME94_09140, partial [Verrucomicrobia bacterium]
TRASREILKLQSDFLTMPCRTLGEFRRRARSSPRRTNGFESTDFADFAFLICVNRDRGICG